MRCVILMLIASPSHFPSVLMNTSNLLIASLSQTTPPPRRGLMDHISPVLK